MSLKIYFTASTSYNGEYKNNYKKIIAEIKKNGAELVSGKQIIYEKLLEKDKKLSKEKIFAREKKLIDEADCVIAEITKPSHGVGGEIVYALVNNKPTLVLLLENHEDKISPMIAGNPSDNLFFEYYNLENVTYKIKNFVNHIRSLKKRKGVLIVIDGGNGSGKTTQTQLLVNYLKKNSMPVKYVDFPQYYSSFHGKTVAKFLRGEFGKIDQVSPYLASLAYALDRASIKNEIEDFLNQGGVIIANRYATSSMAHQGAKFEDEKKREEFLKWLYELEYKVHKIPKENLVIYLHVPWQIGKELTNKKKSRDYLKGKEDIEEKDIKNRINSEKLYLKLAKKYKHWVTINCIVNGQILSPEKIHQQILKELAKRQIIKFDNR
jgi:dTMP kinase